MNMPDIPVYREKQKHKKNQILKWFLVLVGSSFFMYSAYAILDFQLIVRTLLTSRFLKVSIPYENTCPELDGSNELKKWKIFHNLSKSFENNTADWYHYDTNIINANSKIVVLEIDEQYTVWRNMTEGGSSFRVEVTSSNNLSDIIHLNLCHVNDKFNGIYRTCCILTPNMCNTISVYLMYQNFAAFADLKEKPPLVTQIWTKTWCFPEVEGADQPLSFCDSPPPMNAPGHWVYKTSKKYWTWLFDEPHNCLIKFLNKTEIQTCMLNTRPLY